MIKQTGGIDLFSGTGSPLVVLNKSYATLIFRMRHKYVSQGWRISRPVYVKCHLQQFTIATISHWWSL